MTTTNHRIEMLGILAAILIPVSLAPAAWVITEAPMQPGWAGSIELYDINSSGVVCGNGNYVINTSSTPFRYDGTTVTELPVLPEADVPIALATGINADGVICGFSHDADGHSRACYWEGTSLTALPGPEDMNSNLDFRAYELNAPGVIVGYYYSTNGASNVRTAFYYENGTTYSLKDAIEGAGLTGGNQSATGINNNNVICGTAEDASGSTTPWTYDIDSGVLTVISKFSGQGTSVSDISESGEMLGRGKLHSTDKSRVLKYDGSNWHVVDPLVNSTQYTGDINDNGRMVGSKYAASGNRSSWYSDATTNGSMIALELPGWPHVVAEAINNDDVIVGHGETPTSGSDKRGFIYAPPPGDADHDGDIDLDDYTQFAACMSGPKENAAFTPPNGTCLKAFDFAPADGDVDLADFASFQQAFEGSSKRPG